MTVVENSPHAKFNILGKWSNDYYCLNATAENLEDANGYKNIR